MEKLSLLEAEIFSLSETKNLKSLFPPEKVFILTFWNKKLKEKLKQEKKAAKLNDKQVILYLFIQ